MKTSFRILITGSLIINVLVAGLFFVVSSKRCRLSWVSCKVIEMLRPEIAYKWRGAHPKNRLSVFEQLPVGPADTLFIGDSLFAVAVKYEKSSPTTAFT
jgi:hypothetical protein